MKRRSIILQIFLLFLWLGNATGQSVSTMQFEDDRWDFGTIKEVDGIVSHTFVFKNTGNKPFVIEEVAVSCGCTTPEFSRAPILPGKTGQIKVSFDPTDRPGAFNKEIYIMSNGRANRNTLTIRGEVIPRPRSVEEDYPFIMSSGMRFNTLSLNYRYVEQGKLRSMTIGYANTSSKAVSLGFDILPENPYLTVSAPKSICAGCRGEITVTYDFRQAKIWGRMSDRIYPVIDGKRTSLSVSTTVTAVDNFSTMEDGTAPRIRLEPSFHHFGDARRGDRLTREIKLTNEGKSPLIIRWIDQTHGVTSNLRTGTSIAPGQSIRFTVTLTVPDTADGTYIGTMTLVTNDPIRPARDLRLAASIR